MNGGTLKFGNCGSRLAALQSHHFVAGRGEFFRDHAAHHPDADDDDINFLETLESNNDITQVSTVDQNYKRNGTDTLEETAYFLNLVSRSDKPIVIVQIKGKKFAYHSTVDPKT